MTATVQAPERVVAPPRRRSMVVALAAAEGRLLVRHPVVLAGAALTVFLLANATRGQAPVLQRDAIAMGAALFPLAGATLLAVNLAVLRSRRHHTDELYTTLLTTPRQRTGGHLASVAWPVALGIGLVVADLVWLIAVGAIGTPDPFELATGPVIVALAGAVGVLLACLAPSAAAAPLALVAFGAVFVQNGVGYVSGPPAGTDWLLPWVSLNGPAAELAVRPSGWHLAYLAGLAAVAGVTALARHGLGTRTFTVGGLALAVAAGGAVAQARAVTGADRAAVAAFANGAPSTQSCETRGTVHYCAYHDYRPWIDRWDTAVRPVLARLPAGVASQRLDVRQLAAPPSDLESATTGDVLPALAWGRGSDLGEAQLAFAAVVASRAVGLPTVDQQREPPDGVASDDSNLPFSGPCTAAGQARAVVALWLAGQATRETETSLRRMLGDDLYGVDVVGNLPFIPQFYELAGAVGRYTATAPGVEWPRGEAAYATQLLDRPAAQVATALTTDWDRLTDPSTPTEELVTALDLEPVPTLDEALVAAGTPTEDAERLIQQFTSDYPPCA